MEPAQSPVETPGRESARGLSLLSGGLDSMLAICVLREQGCHVEGVVFISPFFNIRAARTAARRLAVPLLVIDFTADIVALLTHPPHGFGKAMNPCIDCHALMIRRAGERVRELGWDFVATGEVLNQRPMSQNRRALAQVAEASGFADCLIRPLSARLLDPTKPEVDGRVDRSRLLDLSGRSRKPQYALAKKHNLRDYPSSAGGCLLTEQQFCCKLQDLKAHEGIGETRDLERLRLGRHFRLPGGAKCIVGRNAGENAQLSRQRQPAETLIRPLSVPGPTVLVSAGAGTDDLERAIALGAGYCDASTEPVRLKCVDAGGTREVTSLPMPRESARPWQL
jgi:tRNA-uridine 2-sulfurtransferase